ncbi:shikimate dehydrogenase [Occallatibacter riparius]|uniref:Multifunctional fusion protein n=1 Tax=Occallatibacter riparius TaxID=1002689 RepID=A0A9J7BG71_9BACT|nr:shikimate dehydrogenase [Occallatibacter riparius]UWZ81996.1 shikimate dehydrogenase [Occallatibacter riparius]
MTSRLPKICVAIQANTPAEMFSRAALALKDARFLEFRLDSLASPTSALPRLKRFLAEHNVTAIATCRRKPNSGSFTGSLDEELSILLKAARAGCQIVDLEIESAEEAAPAQLENFRGALRKAGAQLIVSFHDFSRTRAVERAADRIASFAPDFVKVVATAQTLSDNLAVLRLVEDRSASSRILGIAMGEEGLVSRVLGPRAGGAFTFASLGDGTETAPGQVTAKTMRALYSAHNLNSETRIFGVAGNPIAHSLSPLMHNTAFKREALNAVLLPLKTRTVQDLLNLMLELPMAGAAVTMPLKQEVMPHLAAMDALVERIGACNTLRVGGDLKLHGYNTDVAGVVRPLERRIKLKGARIAVLGAGGAAHAAVFGLVDQGAEVFVINRTHENAVALARSAKAKALKHEQLARHHFDAIINSTPCGMKDSKQALPVSENELNTNLVFDMVYNPLETPLLKLAKSRGIATISGLEMFVQQGARQFEIWTGKTPPEDEMRRVVERELKRRG